MDKLLVYVDQNVISLKVSGKLNIRPLADALFVYSTEHFAEILRASNATKYLDALDDMEAQLVDMELDEDFNPTGRLLLAGSSSAHTHFENHKDAISQVPFDEGVCYPLIVWANGGSVCNEMVQVPSLLNVQIEQVLDKIPLEIRKQIEDGVDTKKEFEAMVCEMIEYDNNILKTRSDFGIPTSGLSQIKGKNQLEKIWEIISPSVPGISLEEFLCFGLVSSYEPTRYQRIVACCNLLDILGFHAEQKIRKLNSVANVQSDARHIALASYCSVLLTKDKKMAERARAIYEYFKIGTQVCFVNTP